MGLSLVGMSFLVRGRSMGGGGVRCIALEFGSSRVEFSCEWIKCFIGTNVLFPTYLIKAIWGWYGLLRYMDQWGRHLWRKGMLGCKSLPC